MTQGHFSKLSLILSSPLCRALDTAIAVYNAQQEPKPPLMTSEWLIEVNMGSFENQPWSMCQWVVDPRLGARATPFPGQGGESLDDLFMRALHIADYLLQAKLDTVLIISHGIFLKELVHALCMRAGDDMSWQQVGWSNSGMTVIDMDKERDAGWCLRIYRINDIDHLQHGGTYIYVYTRVCASHS